MTFTAPDGTGSRTQRAAIASLGREDTALINALGFEARIIYTEPMTPAPKKLDKIVSQTGHEYTVRFVHEILVDGQMAGYKIGVSG
jgi:hypothetical protein